MESSQATKRPIAKVEEVVRTSGLLIWGQLPQHTFSIGRGNFVTVNSYKDQLKVHIRQYRGYGEKFYPTVHGITMDDSQWNELMEQLDIIRLSNNTMSLNMDILPDININVVRPNQCSCNLLVTKVYKSCSRILLLESEQWANLLTIQGKVRESFIYFQFKRSYYSEQIRDHCNLPHITETLIYSTENRDTVIDVLRSTIYKEMDSHIRDNVEEPDDYLYQITSAIFYDGLKKLDFEDIADKFQMAIYAKGLHKYVDKTFFNELNVYSIVDDIRKDMFSYSFTENK